MRFRKKLQNLKYIVLLTILCIVTTLAFIPVFTYLYFAKDLKNTESIMNRNDTGVVLLDRNKTPFFTFYQGRVKQFVPLDEIPDHFQKAIIATEDRDFYTHPGFSVRGILRALVTDIQKREAVYGGSTITQQLVKNVLLHSEKSFLRKYQEIVLAQEIERRFTKDQILEMYLNSVYFGEGAFGVQDAAETYFGKDVSKLTPNEAALLTGLLPSPSTLSPLSGNKNVAIRRQQIVLSLMEQEGYLEKSEREQLAKQEIVFKKRASSVNSEAPHFALMVLDELKRRYGEETISRAGFTVTTSLDLPLQRFSQQTVQEQVTKLARNNATNGAAVIIDPKSGEVLSLVGSKDWYDESFGKVNVALAPRSPGSSFKPIVYAKAFEEKSITSASVLPDSPTTFPGNYKPQDYDRKHRGNVLVRRALANSLNIPAVAVMQKVGVEGALEKAREMQITTLKKPVDYGLSLVLGTGEVPLLEMTNAYAAFAHRGKQFEPTAIKEIADKNGKTIYTYQKKAKQTVTEEAAFLIASILSDTNARREIFGNVLQISRTAAVKTGTAEDYRDALTIGFTPQVVIGVWVGNNDNSPMDQVAGSLGAAPIWKLLIEKYLAGKPDEKFVMPNTMTQLAVCRHNGLRAARGMGGSLILNEYFVRGTEPQARCAFPRPTSPPQATQPPPDAKSQEQAPPPEERKQEEDNGTSNNNGNGKEKNGNGKKKD